MWRYQRQRTYLLILTVGYAMTATGFATQAFAQPMGSDLLRSFGNLCFMVSSWCICRAIAGRYAGSFPTLAMTALAIGGFAASTWFMLVTPSLPWRILSINFAIGAMALLVVAELRPVRRNGPAERALFILASLSAANLLLRPLVVFGLDGPFVTEASLGQSLYWTSALLSHTVISLLMALTLLSAVALEVVNAFKSVSETDALSGLFNRRGFEQRAEALLQRARTINVPAALVLADLDHFKDVNDRFGHDVGDRVIADFAALLRRNEIAGSVVGRLGGEEFVVILPLTDIASARLFAEGIRVSFAAASSVTASFGVAEWLDGEDLRGLLRRADQALYAAKAAGRNRVSAFAEPSGALPQSRAFKVV